MTGAKCTIWVRREQDGGGLLRRIRVLLDGNLVAELRMGESAQVQVGDGRHVLQAKMDWVSSPPLVLECAPGEVRRVKVALPGSALWRSFTSPGSALRAEDESNH
jgi:hypothetical protein